MKYAEYPSHPPLSRWIRCFWVLRGDAVTGSRPPESVFPDGCVEIVVNLADPYLSRHLGVGPRRLERRFRAQVGIGPKRLCRITDQAHLTRDFRDFAGSTPAAFREGDEVLPRLFAGLAASF